METHVMVGYFYEPKRDGQYGKEITIYFNEIKHWKYAFQTLSSCLYISNDLCSFAGAKSL